MTIYLTLFWYYQIKYKAFLADAFFYQNRRCRITTTAKQSWENLSKAYQDEGLTRRVGLLHILITTKLEDCSSVEEYVSRIVTTAHKLTSVGLTVIDEWVGTILLAGLPKHFEPMIMDIEISCTAVPPIRLKQNYCTAFPLQNQALKIIIVTIQISHCKVIVPKEVLLLKLSYTDKEIRKFKKYEQGKADKKPFKGPRCFQCNGYVALPRTVLHPELVRGAETIRTRVHVAVAES